MVATKLMTIEEFADLTDDNVHELVEGEVARMSPAGKTHLLVVSRIGWAIRDFSVLNGAYHGLTGEGGFVLRRNPDSVLAPDISIMTSTQVKAMDELSGTFSTVAP